MDTTREKYIFKPYDPVYEDLFQHEARRLKALLNSNIIIEHVGSTAVPGLGGKGIIDILLIAPAHDDMSTISSILINSGYLLSPAAGTQDRWFHHGKILINKDLVHDCHIHLVYHNSSESKDILSFRNYLRSHPDKAREYSEIKKTAASKAIQGPNRKTIKEIYMSVKEPFIKECLSFTTN